jgi:hypothetical protein
MNNETLKPMDDMRLGYYYILLAYSFGLIFNTLFLNIYKTISLLFCIIILAPLTLMFTDNENYYTNIIITLLFPALYGLLGILESYLLKFLFLKQIEKEYEKEAIKEEELEEKRKEYDLLNEKSDFRKMAKLFSFYIFIILNCFFYIIDITVTALVYFETYRLIRFFAQFLFSVMLIVYIFIIFDGNLYLYWIMIWFSNLTILSTTLFIFNLTRSIKVLYCICLIHFFLILIIIQITILIVRLIKFLYHNKFKLNNNEEQLVIKDDKEIKLNEF